MITKKRMVPGERKAQLLAVAIGIAEEAGFGAVSSRLTARRAGCAQSLVCYYWSGGELKADVMRDAIKREVLGVIAQGLGCADHTAQGAPQELKTRAVAHLAA